jgi:hypothetical protein
MLNGIDRLSTLAAARSGISYLQTALIAAVLLGMAFTPSASADPVYTYTYTGHNFNSLRNCVGNPPPCGYNGGPGTDTNISGFFSLAAPLAANSTYHLEPDTEAGGTITNFAFTDGTNSWNIGNFYANPNASLPFLDGTAVPDFSVTTDASGAITSWDLNIFAAVSFNGGQIGTCTANYDLCGSSTVDGSQAFNNYDDYIYSDPGTWSETQSGVSIPEPTSVLLLAAGLVGLRWRVRRGLV